MSKKTPLVFPKSLPAARTLADSAAQVNFKLDRELLRRLKRLALERETTTTALLTSCVEELLERENF